VAGLETVRAELAGGTFAFRPELEDIHMNVERRLLELVGEVGGKLHTGRRATTRSRSTSGSISRGGGAHRRALRAMQQALLARAAETIDTPMPGYTHMQRAQPIVMAHHLLAYVFMLQRDRERFAGAAARADVLRSAPPHWPARPSRSTARRWPAIWVRRRHPQQPRCGERSRLHPGISGGRRHHRHAPVEAGRRSRAVGDRGIRLREFSDAFATGSSIMPQKKNPDVAELIRGKSGRLYGNLMAVLTVMKGLPLAYNSDMQEDKEAFFDSVDTLAAIGGVLPPMLASLSFRAERMRTAAGENFATATDLADYLVRKGLPFRDGHEIVGKVVRYALERGATLEQLDLEELRRFSDLFGADVHQALTVEASLRARSVVGGTAPEAVRQALAQARALVEG
jgi:argininosuccinate lyase